MTHDKNIIATEKTAKQPQTGTDSRGSMWTAPTCYKSIISIKNEEHVLYYIYIITDHKQL